MMKIAHKFFQKAQNAIKSLSLQKKILILFMGITFLVILFSLLYVANATRKASLNEAKAQMGVTTERNADNISGNLERDLTVVRTLSGLITNYEAMDSVTLFDHLLNVYAQALESNPNITSVWDTWETSDGNVRLHNYVWRESSHILQRKDTIEAQDISDKSYLVFDGDESLVEPYFDSYNDSEDSEMLMTSIVVSNRIGKKKIGTVGIDILLDKFTPLVKQISPYPGSYAFIVSNSLKYIAHPNPDLIGKDAYIQYGEIFQNNGALDRITNGNSTFFEAIDIQGERSYFTIRPITIGKCQLSWSLVLVVPKSAIVKESNEIFRSALLIGLIGILFLGLYIYFASRKYIIGPIEKITNSLDNLSKGIISEGLSVDSSRSDEIGKMENSLAKTVDGLSHKVVFSKEIGVGNYSASLALLSTEDALGKSLIEMGQSLQKAQDEEQKRKAEDDSRQWINGGLAKFGAMLRLDNDNIERLSANITRNLVEYLGANQCGLFILNNDNVIEPTFNLLASYAYNRQKFIQKSILVGEGLVGTCALEKQTIHLTNIPENYITISSGLGEAKPRSLLIVPLKVEEDVLGVVEIASFKDFEPYQIDFIEKVAQSIAQTISTVRTAIKTTELLTRTQQQAEEMKAQEEEVRQNLEELETIKEELEKRNDEIMDNQKDLEMEKSLLGSLLNTLPDRIYFKDLESRFIKVSKSMLKVFSAEREEDLIGKSDFDFFDDEHARPAYEDEQRIISTNKPIVGIVEKEVALDGTITWAETSKLPLKLPTGEIIGTFGISRDITNRIRQQDEDHELQGLKQDVLQVEKEKRDLFDAVASSCFVMEYTPEGIITYVNPAYLDLYGLMADEVIGKHHSFNMELSEEQRENYKKFWTDLNSGYSQHETSRFMVHDKLYMFHETYSPIKNSDGKVYKIIKIAVNVSHLI